MVRGAPKLFQARGGKTRSVYGGIYGFNVLVAVGSIGVAAKVLVGVGDGVGLGSGVGVPWGGVAV